jgi:hypothetical protein
MFAGVIITLRSHYQRGVAHDTQTPSVRGLVLKTGVPKLGSHDIYMSWPYIYIYIYIYTYIDGHLPFLDNDVQKTDGYLGYRVYRKPTQTSLYLHQNSLHHPAINQS